MSYIWPIIIFFSFFAALATKNIENLSSAILSGGTDAIGLAIKLIGMICLWNGLIQIAEKSKLTQKLCRLLSPLLKIIFPELKDEATKEAVAMNMTANILGLDNAATPLGLEAMNRLKSSHHTEIANDTMAKFVVINTACIRIVPTTVALLRQEYGSAAPTEIILPAICTSACALVVGLTATVLLKRVFK
jgi:spore maturation protein A